MPRSDDKSSFSPHEWYSVIASGVFAVAETRLKTASCLAVTIIQFLSSRVLLRHCEWRFARSNPLKLNFATLRIASFFAITSSNVIASGVFAVAETRLKTASCLAVTINPVSLLMSATPSLRVAFRPKQSFQACKVQVSFNTLSIPSFLVMTHFVYCDHETHLTIILLYSTCWSPIETFAK